MKIRDGVHSDRTVAASHLITREDYDDVCNVFIDTIRHNGGILLGFSGKEIMSHCIRIKSLV